MSSGGSHDSFGNIEELDLEEPPFHSSTSSGSSAGEEQGAGAEGSAPTGSEGGPAPEEGGGGAAAEPAGEPEPESPEEAFGLLDRGVEGVRRLFERLRGPSASAASASSGDPRAGEKEVSSKPEPRRPSPASSGGEPWYAVWSVPGALHEVRGLHGGPRAWREIARSIPGGRYRSGTDHLRRSTHELVEALYLSEARKHVAPCPPPSYWWS